MGVSLRRTFRLAFLGALLLAVWLLSSEPWGLGVLQLVVFTAPGALLGLGAGWMAHASAKDAWSWRDAGTAALRGAVILPPVLAFVVALDGNDRPPHLLEGFVRAAWLAFAVGGIVALGRIVRGRRAATRSRRHSSRPSSIAATSPTRIHQGRDRHWARIISRE